MSSIVDLVLHLHFFFFFLIDTSSNPHVKLFYRIILSCFLKNEELCLIKKADNRFLAFVMVGGVKLGWFLVAEALWKLKVEDCKGGASAIPNLYPDRPGEPNCIYYLRTGYCGYGSNCRYNHPTYVGQVRVVRVI